MSHKYIKACYIRLITYHLMMRVLFKNCAKVEMSPAKTIMTSFIIRIFRKFYQVHRVYEHETDKNVARMGKYEKCIHKCRWRIWSLEATWRQHTQKITVKMRHSSRLWPHTLIPCLTQSASFSFTLQNLFGHISSVILPKWFIRLCAC
jgi:hypothetical protein